MFFSQKVVFKPAGSNTFSDYYPFGLTFKQADKDSRFLYNGKELQQESITTAAGQTYTNNLYDYGARFYDATLGRWNSIDPLAEKYSAISPYVYCADNPIKFIDKEGKEIWIYYKDTEGNQTKLQYTQGMSYKGLDKFVSTTITALNLMNSTQNGARVLTNLTASKNLFNFTNTLSKDRKGNLMETASFQSNKNGGGEVHASLLVNPSQGKMENLVNVSHELFHAYQYEHGQTLNGSSATTNNEVESFLFSKGIYYTINKGISSYFPFGNSSTEGGAYEDAMSSLLYGNFDEKKYRTAVNNFILGSSANSDGKYNKFGNDTSLNGSLFKDFFPLIR